MDLVYAGIGARRTPVEICVSMRALAQRLACAGWMLRSGGAAGADSAFAAGAGRRRAIYLPWPEYNGHAEAEAGGVHVVGAREALEKAAAAHHPAWERCSQGVRRLHARNVAILLGERLDEPVAAVVCWTPEGRDAGGTGMGLRIARAHGIPAFNLALQGAGKIEKALARLVERRRIGARKGATCETLLSMT